MNVGDDKNFQTFFKPDEPAPVGSEQTRRSRACSALQIPSQYLCIAKKST
jgi:hypothetical protein